MITLDGGLMPYTLIVLIALLTVMMISMVIDKKQYDRKGHIFVYLAIFSLMAIGTFFLISPQMTSEKGMEWMVGIGQLLLVLFAFITIIEARRTSKETTDKADESIRASYRVSEQLITNNRIEHLNRMLSRLYCPLIWNEGRFLAGAPKAMYVAGSEEYHRFFDDIRSNAYLAGNKLKEPLDALLVEEAKGATNGEGFGLAKGPALEAAKNEYADLVLELDNLTRKTNHETIKACEESDICPEKNPKSSKDDPALGSICEETRRRYDLEFQSFDSHTQKAGILLGFVILVLTQISLSSDFSARLSEGSVASYLLIWGLLMIIASCYYGIVSIWFREYPTGPDPDVMLNNYCQGKDMDYYLDASACINRDYLVIKNIRFVTINSIKKMLFTFFIGLSIIIISVLM